MFDKQFRQGRPLIVLVVLVAGACDRRPELVAPHTGGVVSAQSMKYFYYHQGKPVQLTLDPGHVIVSASNGGHAATARSVLAGLDVDVGDGPKIGNGLQAEHTLLRLNGASQDKAERAIERLRSDP